jgi:hypothetical protein
VNSTIQAPRRKFVDEGKLRKVIDLYVHALFFFLNVTYVRGNKEERMESFNWNRSSLNCKLGLYDIYAPA